MEIQIVTTSTKRPPLSTDHNIKCIHKRSEMKEKATTGTKITKSHGHLCKISRRFFCFFFACFFLQRLDSHSSRLELSKNIKLRNPSR